MDLTLLKKLKRSFSVKHKKQGRIYLPHYNTTMPYEADYPEIYNSDGEKMKIFFLRDKLFANLPYGNSKYFIFDRYNFGLDTHFYTHDSMLETEGNPHHRYGCLIESEAIVPEDYMIFDRHKGLEKDFDKIFTFSDKILNKIDNAVFMPFCAYTWYGTEYGGGEIKEDAFEHKTRNISILSSNKVVCDMHKLRLKLAQKCKKENLADTFGTFDGGSFVKIAQTLQDYRYSVALENDLTDYFFTERITSCFAAMTVPIYCGARKISEFFNPDGIIQITVKDFDNIENVLRQCNEQDYESRLPAIKDNFMRAAAYKNIWNKLYEEIFK